MKKHLRIKDLGPYLVDEKQIGEFNDHTQGIVMDSVADREKLKPKVKIMRTENMGLLAGSSTVALFKITKRHAANMTPQ
jgi:hypothetical protein